MLVQIAGFFLCFFVFHLFLDESLPQKRILCGSDPLFIVGPITKWWLLHFVCHPLIVANATCVTILVQSRVSYKNKFKNSLRTY